MKTLYLWDLGNTLFPEKWSLELTGFATFDDYLASLGKSFNKDARDCVEQEKEFYIHGQKYGLEIALGFREVLTWTKNNEAFTSGSPESLSWRALYLNPKVGYDIEKLFINIFTTFEYGNTIIKTTEMLVDHLKKKIAEGYDTVVYTDDKAKYCLQFVEATKMIEGLKFRVYNIMNDDNGLRKKDCYWEIGSLYDLLENEKNYEKNF